MIPAQLFIGAGTVINALCIVVGAAVGTLFGEHLPSRVRDAVTPVLPRGCAMRSPPCSGWWS
ncbi:DUF554 domain-containing protein [Propionibacterium freudenreichii]|uniref:DUF554 family protein n=1 Tax=Propionibacterium freudenreichii TaxID=1744 RepID=UPI0024344A31|nr:DUF554 family protein [Propionibacterium freudenreichii]WFF31889.1 DUF554 domain-containing protein [Propionibacterium freudenreichii]